MLASGSTDRTVKLWRASDGSLIRALDGHTEDVNAVAFSPDGSMVASGSFDKTVKLWRALEFVYGDLTGDGKVQVVDATRALRIALKIEPATEAQLAAADVDRDGGVTVRDVTRILRRAVGLIPSDRWP